MVGKIPRKARDKSSYINYLKKAQEFIKTMEDCIEKGYFDSASLNGIHAIISSIDALLVFYAGIMRNGTVPIFYNIQEIYHLKILL